MFTTTEKTQSYGNLDGLARMASIDDSPVNLAILCEAKKISVASYWEQTRTLETLYPTWSMVMDDTTAKFDRPVKTPEQRVRNLLAMAGI